jgi:hypothetical protein
MYRSSPASRAEGDEEITTMKEWATFATAVAMALLVQMLIVGL